MSGGANPAGGVDRWREVDAAEKARHEHTAAVAQRIALHEACIMLDARAAEIMKGNPGRRKDTLSKDGQKLYDSVKTCADMVWALHQSIWIPEKDGPLYVTWSVHRRELLEAEVERQVPGTYPRRATAATPSLPSGERG